MTKCCISFLTLLLIATLGGSRVSRVHAAESPNLLVLFLDQFRAQALGVMEQDPVVTPNLDMLAGEGILFTNAVANYPLCSPMRAMFMTGKYPFDTGVVANCMSYEGQPDYQENLELKDEEITWSDVLKAKGYTLGYIGKWHLTKPREPYIDCLNNEGTNKWNEWTPPDRRHGFDYWYAYNTYDYHLRPLYWSIGQGRNEFHYVDTWGPTHEADKAIQYLTNEDDALRDPSKPFALVVSMNPPHDDGIGDFEEYPARYDEAYEGKTVDDLANRPNAKLESGEWSDFTKKHVGGYFAMVTGVDDQIGRILASLEELDLDQRTIVMLIADHGELMGSHDKRGKNFPYEEAMRIPLIIRWPQVLEARDDDLMLSIPDLYPTLLGLMGLDAAVPESVSGVDFSNYLMTGSGETPDSQLYIKVGDTLLSGMRGLRTPRYTFVVNKDPDNGLDSLILYDNANDPYQLDNIATRSSVLIDSLKLELADWLERTGDPFEIH